MMSLIVAASIAAQTAPKTDIGPYYTECPNGIAFIEGGKQVALLRVGWIEEGKYLSGYADLSAPERQLRYGVSAPDGSYQELSWKAGKATIRFEWSRKGPDGAVGRIQVDAPLRIALETATDQAFLNQENRYWSARTRLSRLGQEVERATYTLVTATTRELLAGKILAGVPDVAEGKIGATVVDVHPGQELLFRVAYGTPELNPPSFEDLRAAALKNAPAAGGEWGDFLAPISACMHFGKTFNPETKRIAHTVSRGWCMPDGQVLFCWDSFFNGLLASLDDPEGAKDTVRAALAGMTKAGFVPNFSGRPWGTSEDRSQPPVAAMCVWKMHQRHPDVAFLKEVYPKLVRWHNWWFSKRKDSGKPTRDGNQNGLLEWGSETGDLQNAKFESGLDDSPMFDDASMSGPNMRMESVDLNSLWAMDAEYLALIAAEIGKTEDAKRFKQERADMAKKINEVLWDEEVGMYCNRFWEPVQKKNHLQLEELLSNGGKPGMKAEYFAGRAFRKLVATRTDPKVDFEWSDGPCEGLSKYDYSVRWTGQFTPKFSGPVHFGVTSDDGVRLWVDGKLLVDQWTIHGPERRETEAIQMVAGKPHDLKIEFFQAEGGATMKLDAFQIDANGPKKWFNTRLSPCNFYPMIAGIPTKDRAERMVKTLLDPSKFWGEFVCPTIQRDDPAFPQQHYWRGKIWAPSNYLMWLGLKRYAPQSVLDGFAEKSVALFMRNWNKDATCHENFLSSGEGSSDPHYTWGALLCLIGLENILDVTPDGKVKTNPRPGIGVKNVPINGKMREVKGK